MTVIDFLRLTRRSWGALLIFVILGAAAMFGYTAISPKVYQANSLGFIVAGTGGVISSSQDAVNRVSAYLPLISTAPVLQKIQSDPTIDTAGGNLAGRLSANIVGGTTMIQVSADAPTPESALALANGGLTALTEVIKDVETAASGGQPTTLSVVPLQNAGLPSTPISPKVRTNVALGAIGGLLIGYLFVFLRRGLETRVRSIDELTALTGAGLLGAIPRVSKGAVSIDATDRDSVLAAEAIRQVRTALSFSSVDREIRCIAVTSANASEGKTTVATRLAQVFARSGREVVVIEAAEGIGTVTSSRNSEVIHAGIYYPSGSLMARMCVSGRQALYAYCRDHDIPHRNCGKLIVATRPEEVDKLQSIKARAAANGVGDMQLLSGKDARALEPALDCQAALLSPSTDSTPLRRTSSPPSCVRATPRPRGPGGCRRPCGARASSRGRTRTVRCGGRTPSRGCRR